METNCRIGKVTPKGNVALFPSPETTTENISPNKVLRRALGQLDTCIIVGLDLEDTLWVSSSDGDRAHITFLLQQAIQRVLEQ